MLKYRNRMKQIYIVEVFLFRFILFVYVLMFFFSANSLFVRALWERSGLFSLKWINKNINTKTISHSNWIPIFGNSIFFSSQVFSVLFFFFGWSMKKKRSAKKMEKKWIGIVYIKCIYSMQMLGFWMGINTFEKLPTTTGLE